MKEFPSTGYERAVTARAKHLGVVSDTHGLFDPALAAVFGGLGVEAILHAGDICGAAVLESLAEVAPVVAIVGNCDSPPLTRELPEYRVETFDGEPILVLHDLGTPDRLRPRAAQLIREHRPRIVVSGHSHQGRVEAREGTLFVNPGSAGRKRFKLLRSVATLTFRPGGIEARLLSLEGEVGRVVAAARIRRTPPRASEEGSGEQPRRRSPAKRR